MVYNINAKCNFHFFPQYFEVLIGPLISLWIKCELSMAALVEVKTLALQMWISPTFLPLLSDILLNIGTVLFLESINLCVDWSLLFCSFLPCHCVSVFCFLAKKSTTFI